MSCIICRMRWLGGATETPIRGSSYMVGGAAVCAVDVDHVIEALLGGASMKDILGEAKAGDW